MTDNKVSLPGWAISDEEVGQCTPEKGFIKDYIDYMTVCTDAPSIYHLGACLSLLSCASCFCEVQQMTDYGKNEQPMILWIALIGYSGDRKSTAMEGAKNLLSRFRMATPEKRAILPAEGSMEALHDTLCESPNVLMYRDELAQLFDARRKSYMSGMTSWLLELYSGQDRPRVTKSKQGGGNGNGDNGSSSRAPDEGDPGPASGNNEMIIKRPRVNILGGIPPDTFKSKATKGDWSSGFLARFKFFGGKRLDWKLSQVRDEAVETELARWLHKVPWESRGKVVLYNDINKRIGEWIYDNVELPRQRELTNQDMFSQLMRLQEFGCRVAALYAMSRQKKPQLADGGKIKVDHSDVDRVLCLLEALKRSSMSLFEGTVATVENSEEQEILDWLKTQDVPPSYRQTSKAFPAISSRKVKVHIMTLIEKGLVSVSRTKPKGPGRPYEGFTAIN